MIATNITRFRELVFSDFALASQLHAITDHPAFIAAVIDIASANGILLGANEISQQINSGMRSWLERWI